MSAGDRRRVVEPIEEVALLADAGLVVDGRLRFEEQEPPRRPAALGPDADEVGQVRLSAPASPAEAPCRPGNGPAADGRAPPRARTSEVPAPVARCSAGPWSGPLVWRRDWRPVDPAAVSAPPFAIRPSGCVPAQCSDPVECRRPAIRVSIASGCRRCASRLDGRDTALPVNEEGSVGLRPRFDGCGLDACRWLTPWLQRVMVVVPLMHSGKRHRPGPWRSTSRSSAVPPVTVPVVLASVSPVGHLSRLVTSLVTW